ncbi:hydrogenobyrinic acid a,c-diamide synthase (glutamine-hydrolysing) [Desulfitobacterium dichloroeliminans LMG P-21439]|uniref:Cobyrinate a,c-diamide synthase n=1 Tax=Desulfitobacterium dichloroeliminans (strain LMG P-21439 / DCA1) TaxID=871963 RepID=L0F7D4_DESDL|nr:cobyrinate a,c-diamide synthase [Desulfitobacterium dichloroeliminans]AGA68546.1 hydrogenobyrinic acid a,c-diamide synthase (glutamine-hydrolysing) [Desulfitobacterium dichloroeliminans LMG P-21439]
MLHHMPPRILISGTHSGVGKTTIATGIMAALAQKELPVQPYKVGPDYIDPSYHTLATGRPSRNLDRWMLREELVPVFLRSSLDHWVVIEGVMGLFDGVSGTKGYGSSADIAKLLNTPVVLIVDAGNLSRSVAAMVHGFSTFDPDLRIAGVILNRVKSPAQENILREALKEIEIPIFGVLPKEEGIRLPERHLGLVPSQEKAFQEGFFEELIDVVSRTIDLDAIQRIMQETPQNDKVYEQNIALFPEKVSEDVDANKPAKLEIQDTAPSKGNKRHKKVDRQLRLGVAWDEAFSFYYQDAFDLANNLGFVVIPFSPLQDQGLPERLDGLFFGGGFPELHLERLSQNLSFLESLKKFHRSGKTIYGECGGYMYLGQQITDFEGKTYPMADLIPITAEMTRKLRGMGYREGVFQQDNFLGVAGNRVYGHEFHYSEVRYIDAENSRSSAFELLKGGESLRLDGYARDNIVASYLHLNFAGHPELLQHWAEYLRQGV